MNTIGGPARVFFRAAPTEEEERKRQDKEEKKRRVGTGNDDDEDGCPQLPKDAFTCRYAIRKMTQAAGDKGNDTKKMEVFPYEQDEVKPLVASCIYGLGGHFIHGNRWCFGNRQQGRRLRSLS